MNTKRCASAVTPDDGRPEERGWTRECRIVSPACSNAAWLWRLFPHVSIEVRVFSRVRFLVIRECRFHLFDIPQRLSNGVTDEFRPLPGSSRRNMFQLRGHFVIQLYY